MLEYFGTVRQITSCAVELKKRTLKRMFVHLVMIALVVATFLRTLNKSIRHSKNSWVLISSMLNSSLHSTFKHRITAFSYISAVNDLERNNRSLFCHFLFYLARHSTIITFRVDFKKYRKAGVAWWMSTFEH